MDQYLLKTSSTESLASKRPAEEALWSESKRQVVKAKKLPQVKPINTSNRFGSLAVDSNEGQLDNPALASFKKASKKRQVGQIPPILIELLGDWCLKDIKETIEKYEKSYHLQYRGRTKVKVQCYSTKGHHLLKEGLLKEKVAFHTFSRKDEKLPKAVIKGLPKYLQEDVPAELSEMGWEPR